jgi:hypothetical protein
MSGDDGSAVRMCGRRASRSAGLQGELADEARFDVLERKPIAENHRAKNEALYDGSVLKPSPKAARLAHPHSRIARDASVSVTGPQTLARDEDQASAGA